MSAPLTAASDPPPAYRPWLHRFAILLVVATFLLLITGGNVTSRDAGLAVPDWPTTYHQNMFTFPISQWKGGILYEHSHRLTGSLVGFLCIGMTVALWLTQRARPWLRWAGVALLALVVVQGVMGGLRVTELSWKLAVLHGVHGQLFLCLTVLIAAATGRFWLEAASGRAESGAFPSGMVARRVRALSLALLAMLLVQLTLGAATRHTGAGLAIPDFPTAYGRVIPPLTQDGLNAAAASGVSYDRAPARVYTPAQVGVHFAHRVWAVAVVAAALALATAAGRGLSGQRGWQAPALAVLLMLAVQATLGAGVIWTERNPDLATAHQALGAAILATAALLAIRLHLLTAAADDLTGSTAEATAPRERLPGAGGGLSLGAAHS